MKIMKKAVLLFFACVLCAAPVQAETKPQDAYTETVLTLPEGLSTRLESFLQMSVHGDQLDIFLEQDELGGKLGIVHYRSADGGKSWKQQDLGWLSDTMKKLSQPSSHGQVRLAAGKEGEVYALFDTGGQVDLPVFAYNYYKGKLIRYQDGVTKELLTLDDPDFYSYDPLGVSLGSGTELVVWAVSQGEGVDKYTGKKTADAIQIYDLTTGKLRSSVPCSGPDGIGANPVGYAGGKIFNSDGDKITVADAETRRITQSVASADSSQDEGFGGEYASGPDGAFYDLRKSGLYRLRPGSSQWERLLDESVCKLGTAGSNDTACRSLQVSEDGSIYVLLRHDDQGEFRTEAKAMTLSRYTPKNG